MTDKTLQDRLQSLDDHSAQRILITITSLQNPTNLVWEPALAEALSQAFERPETPPTLTSPGTVARMALCLLAEQPDYPIMISSIMQSQPYQNKIILETRLVITSVLFTLQIHLDIEQDRFGKYSVTIKNKATETHFLTELVQKLLNLR